MARITTYPAKSVGILYGVTQDVFVPSPGAGNEWVFKVPGGYMARLVCGAALLQTSATVANRVPTLRVTDGTNIRYNSPGLGATTASNTAVVGYSGSSPVTSGTNTNTVNGTGIPEMWMQPGWQLQSFTTGLAAGDTYTNIVLTVDFLDLDEWGNRAMVHSPTIREFEETVEPLLPRAGQRAQRHLTPRG